MIPLTPAAANYQASITKAIGDADTALSTIIECLVAAENHQIYYVGEGDARPARSSLGPGRDHAVLMTTR